MVEAEVKEGKEFFATRSSSAAATTTGGLQLVVSGQILESKKVKIIPTIVKVPIMMEIEGINGTPWSVQQTRIISFEIRETLFLNRLYLYMNVSSGTH